MLGYNQLVGSLPSLKLMRALKAVSAKYNFLTGAAEGLPACPTYQLFLDFNCFAVDLNFCGSDQTQKSSGWAVHPRAPLLLLRRSGCVPLRLLCPQWLRLPLPAIAHSIMGSSLHTAAHHSLEQQFDSVLSVKHSDPNDNHVGVNVGGSPVSLASATAPLILNDGHTKHAWIHYDPTSGGTLRVFLSASRQQPSKAVVTARVSLCSALKPTIGDSSFLFGFVAASLKSAQGHDVLKFLLTQNPRASKVRRLIEERVVVGSAFGMVASAEEVAAGGEGESVPVSFHYSSLSFLPTTDTDSSAYAVVAAVEAAYSIASNGSQPPRLSVEQLRVALSANCDDMPPRDVLAFLVAATRKGGGLVDDAAAAAASPHSMASAGRRERLAAVSCSEWWVLVVMNDW
ncbi:unnamed protein product [Closterium sp. Naga37s-1]|nr:unnamed protein product [Closterium sp. Naga37s-1]